MRKTILSALLALSLTGAALGEVIRANSTIFNPEGPSTTNQLQDIPQARNLGDNRQTQKVVVSLKSSLPAYLEKANLDTAVHRAGDFTAASGNRLTSPIEARSALGGSGKRPVASNRLDPINL